MIDDQIRLVGGDRAARSLPAHDGTWTQVEKRLVQLRKVVGEVDLLLPGGGEQRHAIPRLDRTA